MPVQCGLWQQRRRECAGDGRLAESGLADEKVCVRQSLGGNLRSQLIQGSRVSGDAGERIGHDSED
jgi:hypothetical protein